MTWRNHIVNNSHGGKSSPLWISPGGHICYKAAEKYPQLPAPTLLQIDYPYIVLDNWTLRFFPVTNSRMAWLSDSATVWVRQRRNEKNYKKQIIEFINELECISRRNP